MNFIQKIYLILTDEDRQYQAQRATLDARLGSLKIKLPPQLLAHASVANAVTSENVERLIKLHAMLDAASQKRFCSVLMTQLTKPASLAEVGYLSFVVLHRLSRTIEAIEAAKARDAVVNVQGKRGRDWLTYHNIKLVLAALTAYEYGQFSGAFCEKIRDAVGFDKDHQVRERINQVLLKHLDVELGDANPEIFADRDRLVSIWEKGFGTAEIPELIGHIDQYFREGDASPVLLATCVDRIRALLAHVCRSIASRYAELGRKAAAEGLDEKAILQHLRSIKVVDDAEWNMLRALYDKASTVGGHAVTATKEEARIVRNMTYEMLLLLMERMPSPSTQSAAPAA